MKAPFADSGQVATDCNARGRVGVGGKAFYDPTRVSLGPMNSGYDPGHPIRDADIKALSEHLAGFAGLTRVPPS